MRTKYDQIVDVNRIASFESRENISEIIALGKAEKLMPASKDKERTLLLAIDIQNDFMEDIGSLGVLGSRSDVKRLTKWMYTNLNKISQVICSLDSHSINQIFHSSWWVDAEGKQPKPFTTITYNDVKISKWKPISGELDRNLEYLAKIEEKGKKQLCIWPYHCLEGTLGAKLESEFTKMLYFHSATRNTTPIFMTKGQDPHTEMYGIVKAEYDPTNKINNPILDAIVQFDRIYIAGEASSHCVLASIKQIAEYFSDRRDITSRITLLEDCMSPIVGFEEITKKQYSDLKDKYGIQIKKSTEVIL